MVSAHKKILLIEDNPTDVRLIQETLAGELWADEFELRNTDCLSQAAELLSTQDFNLILCLTLRCPMQAVL